MATNQRLRDAIRRSDRPIGDLADDLGVDPKTIERWISAGRLPHPTSRRRLSDALAVPEAILWPDAPGTLRGTPELMAVYVTRRELSPATIASLIDATKAHLDVLAYAALWLWDSVPNFAERLVEKATSGVQVRICLGDPASDAVALRGQEEGIGDGMASRCRLAAIYALPIHRVSRGAVRLTGSTLYSSILRFDNDLLVNMHLLGNPASNSPVFHLRRRTGGEFSGSVLRSFERTWEQAQPLSVG